MIPALARIVQWLGLFDAPRRRADLKAWRASGLAPCRQAHALSGLALPAGFGLGPVAGFICRRDITERVDGWS